MYMYYLLSFLGIDEEEIWEDFVKMIADNVENHSLSAFNIAILLPSLASKSEFRGEPRDRTLLHLDQNFMMEMMEKKISKPEKVTLFIVNILISYYFSRKYFGMKKSRQLTLFNIFSLNIIGIIILR